MLSFEHSGRKYEVIFKHHRRYDPETKRFEILGDYRGTVTGQDLPFHATTEMLLRRLYEGGNPRLREDWETLVSETAFCSAREMFDRRLGRLICARKLLLFTATSATQHFPITVVAVGHLIQQEQAKWLSLTPRVLAAWGRLLQAHRVAMLIAEN